jgi:hypothetical protein
LNYQKKTSDVGNESENFEVALPGQYESQEDGGDW